MPLVRSFWIAIAALAVACNTAFTQSEASYPNQRVTIVVPFSAGSITDGLARVLADKLADVWKQQIIVENQPGIAGN